MKYMFATVALAILTLCQNTFAREHIEIVGSSTVFDLSALVAEEFGATTAFKAPTVESIGSSGGFKRFCSGVGFHFPDIANASRKIKAHEVERCKAHGVEDIVEVKIGYDGIALASASSKELPTFSSDDLYLALAKYVPNPEIIGEVMENPYRFWDQINAKLPHREIRVYGPPLSSGTREAFIDLIVSAGCAKYPWLNALNVVNPERYQLFCRQLREDGAYISVGENDQLIVQRLRLNLDALGLFGYGVLLKNQTVIRAVSIDGFLPTEQSIASGDYRLARPLYFYVKGDHVGLIAGLADYVELFMSSHVWGSNGYLSRYGMIPMSAFERATQRRRLHTFTQLRHLDKEEG